MRSFSLYRKKTIFVITSLLYLSSCGLYGQVAETATVVLHEVLPAAAAIIYRAAMTRQQQPHLEPTFERTTYSYPQYGTSTVQDPLGAIRYAGAQSLRQNREVFELVDRYKPQMPSPSHGPAYAYAFGGTGMPQRHGTPNPTGPASYDFSIPAPGQFNMPALHTFSSQPIRPYLNIPYVPGDFRIAPPNFGPVNNGLSVSIGYRQNVRMESSADYIIHVPRYKQHSFKMQDPDYAESFSRVVGVITNMLIQANSDREDFPTLINRRIQLATLYIDSGDEGDYLDDALLDLMNIFFNEHGDLIYTCPSEAGSIVILNYLKHLYGQHQMASVVQQRGVASSDFYSNWLISRSINGERPPVRHVLNLQDMRYQVLNNKNNQVLSKIYELLGKLINPNGPIGTLNFYYEADDLINYLSPMYQSYARRFQECCLGKVKDKAPDVYNQFMSFDRYGMSRTYASDPRWKIFSHEEKQAATSTPDAKLTIKTFYDLRQSVAKEIAHNVGLGENVLGEVSGISKAIWDLVDHATHPCELSQARIAQAFDPNTYRFRYGNNDQLEAMLKKVFETEADFKAKVDAHANKPEIPYSPLDVKEPLLERKPEAQPSATANTQPTGGPHNGTDPNGGGFSTTGGSNDDPNKFDCSNNSETELDNSLRIELINKIEGLIKKDGKLLGTEGDGPLVREVKESPIKGRELFYKIVEECGFAKKICPHPDPKIAEEGGLIVKIGKKFTIAWRPFSSSGPATLDIHIEELERLVKKFKFLGE